VLLQDYTARENGFFSPYELFRGRVAKKQLVSGGTADPDGGKQVSEKTILFSAWAGQKKLKPP
jgi:hypothetical protein